MKPKHVWVSIFLMFAAMVIYGQFDSYQRQKERDAAVLQYAGKSFGELFPDSYSGRRVEGEALKELVIGGKKITTGLTWDDSLPLLDQGKRLANERLDPDVFIEVRSFREGTYAFTFARGTSGPYRLTSMETGPYFKDVAPRPTVSP